MFTVLKKKGFQIEFCSHAQAILQVDFPQVEAELTEVLLNFKIPASEIVSGGGGEAKGTQRLRNALNSLSWPKYHFTVERTINGVTLESQSHEVDHVREFDDGSRVALEIEWNNKDPFYDRDLENFKRLHADGAISVGGIITRGTSLHEGLKDVVENFLRRHGVARFEDLSPWGYTPTVRQRKAIEELQLRLGGEGHFVEAFSKRFVADKFGEATTHWRKLDDRVRRGVGNPCPLLLIGLPRSIILED